MTSIFTKVQEKTMHVLILEVALKNWNAWLDFIVKK